MKRILSFALSLVMIVGIMTVMPASVVNAAEGEFSDVKAGAWYEETLNIMIDQNIIAGYPDGTFKGTNEMTRDQFIKTMVVAIAGEQPLGDSYWASEYIKKAIELGVIKKGQFDTYNVKITRGEMAAIAENTLTSLKVKFAYKYEKDIKSELKDLTAVNASDYTDAILHMYEQGVLMGYPDGEFKTDGGLKRQEAIVVIRRVIDVDYRKSYEPTPVVIPDRLSHVDYWPEELIKACEETGITPFEVMKNGKTTDLRLTADNMGEIKEKIGSKYITMYQVGTIRGPEIYDGNQGGFDIFIGFSNDEKHRAIIKQCFREIMKNYAKIEDEEIEKILAYYEECNAIFYSEMEKGNLYNIYFNGRRYFHDIYGRELFTVNQPIRNGFKIMSLVESN